MSCHIVFAKPRVGKTTYLAAVASRLMDFSLESRVLIKRCASEVRALNAAGADFEIPRTAPVYSNFPIHVSRGQKYYESFYIDGFHLGMENEDVDVLPVLPNSFIFLSEAQRYYNSRRSKDLPSWVSRFYEQHGHFGLTIYLDVQRPALIDVNIREITDEFIEVLGLEHEYDRRGNISATRFKLRRFTDWKWVEKYLAGSPAEYEDFSDRYEGCIFDNFESKSYYKQFIPSEGQFSMIDHPRGDSLSKNVELSKSFYPQSPPPGYYGGGKK